jgi:UDP-N-acetylmuramoylalanine--D-glutamate ligase
MSFIAQLAGKKCLVIGAGVTGRALKEPSEGFKSEVVIFDENSKTGTVSKVPSDIQLAITSPGWRKDHEIFNEIKKISRN